MDTADKAFEIFTSIQAGKAFAHGNWTFKKTPKPKRFGIQHTSGKKRTVSAAELQQILNHILSKAA